MKRLALCLGLLWAVPALAGLLEAERARLLADSRPQPDGLRLELPEWVEDGAFIALTVHLQGARPPVELLLLREAEDEPRIARVRVHEWQEPLQLSTRLRLLQSQSIQVLARDAEGRSWASSQPVRIAGSSCLNSPQGDPAAGLGESQAWRRRLVGGEELASLLRHPMESGQRRDAAGQLLPRHLLKRFRLSRAGQPLMEAQSFAGQAVNPYWRLLLPADSRVWQLDWQDDRGAHFQRQLEPLPAAGGPH